MVCGNATNIYFDNHSVVQNMMLLESKLNKQISLVAYNYVRYAVAENTIIIL